jgi:hypothetical protein
MASKSINWLFYVRDLNVLDINSGNLRIEIILNYYKLRSIYIADSYNNVLLAYRHENDILFQALGELEVQFENIIIAYHDYRHSKFIDDTKKISIILLFDTEYINYVNIYNYFIIKIFLLFNIKTGLRCLIINKKNKVSVLNYIWLLRINGLLDYKKLIKKRILSGSLEVLLFSNLEKLWFSKIIGIKQLSLNGNYRELINIESKYTNKVGIVLSSSPTHLEYIGLKDSKSNGIELLNILIEYINSTSKQYVIYPHPRDNFTAEYIERNAAVSVANKEKMCASALVFPTALISTLIDKDIDLKILAYNPNRLYSNMILKKYVLREYYKAIIFSKTLGKELLLI